MRTSSLVLLSATLGFLAGASNLFSAEQLTGTVKSAAGSLEKTKVILYRAGANTKESSTVIAQTFTDEKGTFAMEYQAQSPNRLLYVVTRSGEDSPAQIRFSGVLGMGGKVPSAVVINELTTVAASWSMAQFFHNESIAGKTLSLKNAASMAVNLADIETGKIGAVINTAPNGPKTTTRAIFYSLANLLAGSVDSTSDRQLFLSLARLPGETRPNNTLAALQSMARNPQNSVGGLYAVSKRSHAYDHALSSKPSGWMIPLQFSSAGFTGPGAFAFDSEGFLWATANFKDGTTDPANFAYKFLPNGEMAFGSVVRGGGIYGSAWGLMVDEKDRAWFGDFVANHGTDGKGGVTLFSKQGQPISPSKGYSFGGINRPQGIARDSKGNVWIGNFQGNSLTKYIDGNPHNSVNYPDIPKPFGVAVDGRDRVWVTNGPRSTVSIVNPDGTLDPKSPISGGGLLKLKGLALDSFGNAWVSNSIGAGVTMIRPDGTVHPKSPFKGGGVESSWGICVDGDDNIWVAGFGNFSVAKLAGARASTRPRGKELGDPISPSTGFTSNALLRLTAVAVDSSGNLWTANNWKRKFTSAIPAGSGIIAFVGMAAPVKTPMLGLPKKP